MRAGNEVVFTSTDMSSSITSAAFPVYQVFGWAAQFVYTGSPNGVLKVQVSCDPVPQGGINVPVPTNWSDLGSSSVTIAAAGDNTYNVDLSFYSWIRFVYTRSSGTGTFTSSRLNIKGV